MIDMDWTILGVLVVPMMLVALYFVLRRSKLDGPAPTNIRRDWQPTGAINFVVPDEVGKSTAAMFFLEVEEDRVVELLGGGDGRETRFRLATLAEAIVVVRAYQAGDIKIGSNLSEQ